MADLCKCGAPAVTLCPICGPECLACFMPGADLDLDLDTPTQAPNRAQRRRAERTRNRR